MPRIDSPQTGNNCNRKEESEWSAATSAVYRERKFAGRKYSAVNETYRTCSRWWYCIAVGLVINAEKTSHTAKAGQNAVPYIDI